MNEIFKDIPNYDGVYKVSNKGNIKRILKGGREKFNKLTKLNNGYLAVQLSSSTPVSCYGFFKS